MLSRCNIIKNLLYLVLENSVELLMSNTYLRSHNPEKGNNLFCDFKCDRIGFQTFISDSLDFLEVACNNIMHKRNVYISNQM